MPLLLWNRGQDHIPSGKLTSSVMTDMMCLFSFDARRGTSVISLGTRGSPLVAMHSSGDITSYNQAKEGSSLWAHYNMTAYNISTSFFYKSYKDKAKDARIYCGILITHPPHPDAIPSPMRHPPLLWPHLNLVVAAIVLVVLLQA